MILLNSLQYIHMPFHYWIQYHEFRTLNSHLFSVMNPYNEFVLWIHAHRADRESVESERDNSKLWKIMDRINAIILCFTFRTWIQRIWGLSGKNRNSMIYCIALCSMTKDLAGIRRFSSSLCCLQGISIPWAEKDSYTTRGLGVYEVYQNPLDSSDCSDTLDTGPIRPKANTTEELFWY